MSEQSDDKPDEMIGRHVGNWRIERLLGAGGMGRVYLCEHLMLGGKRAALKLLLPEVSGNAMVVDRFLAEARAAGAIDSPNIIEVLDAGRLDGPAGQPYIVMRFVEGPGSLEDYCAAQGPLPVAMVCEILVQACAALAAAHARGIVHRDIKPANLLLTSRTESEVFIIVTDFGIAKVFDPGLKAGLQTKTNTVIGTPGYMAPEQSRALAIDARADIYSLGVIGYRLLLGKLPFEGGSFADIVIQQMTAEPPDLSRVRPDVPAPFAAVLRAALAVDPDLRPHSARELAHQLAAAVPEGVAILERVARSLLPIAAASPTMIAPAAGAGTTTVVAPAGAAPGSSRPPTLPTTPMAAEIARPPTEAASGPPRRRRLWPAALGALAVTAVAAIILVGVLRDRGDDSTASTPVAVAVDAGVVAAKPLTSGGATGPVDPAASIDAGLAPRPVAADAGSTGVQVTAPPVDAGAAQPHKDVPAVTGSGTVLVQVTPWAAVTLDGAPIGETPARRAVSAGRHVIVIANEDLGRKETIRIKVVSGKKVSIKRSW